MTWYFSVTVVYLFFFLLSTQTLMVFQLKDIIEAWGLTFQNLSSMTPLVLPAKNIVRALRFEIIVDDKISELPRLIMEPRIRYFEQSKRRFRKYLMRLFIVL